MRILLTGSTGFLGRQIAGQLRHRAEVIGLARGGRPSPTHLRADLTALEGLDRAIRSVRPGAIVHAGAMADVRACERQADLAARCNAHATEHLAKAAADLGISLVFISTDQVFDGTGSWYKEDNTPSPVNTYGRTKAEAEQAVLSTCPSATVVRLALVIGRSPGSRPSASDQVVTALRANSPPTLFTDEYRTPIHVADAARLIADLAVVPDRPRIIHLAGPDRVSRYELGSLLARAAGLDPSAIRAATHAEVQPLPARPADVSLDTTLLRAWTDRPPRGINEAAKDCLSD